MPKKPSAKKSVAKKPTAKNPLPEIPASFKVPGFKKPLPAHLPLYYGALQSIWIYFQVELEILRKHLDPLGMAPASFGQTGAVNINFFNAVALSGMGEPGIKGLLGFNETEVNILAFASNQAVKIPKMSLQDF